MYAKFFKRAIDLMLSLMALGVLSPMLLILGIIGAIAMKGNPFFLQLRPGKKGKDGKEKIFRLIKFRTMSNAKDKDGNLLPDDVRLNTYGKFLRSTSLDELPELINILIGDMAVVVFVSFVFVSVSIVGCPKMLEQPVEFSMSITDKDNKTRTLKNLFIFSPSKNECVITKYCLARLYSTFISITLFFLFVKRILNIFN